MRSSFERIKESCPVRFCSSYPGQKRITDGLCWGHWAENLIVEPVDGRPGWNPLDDEVIPFNEFADWVREAFEDGVAEIVLHPCVAAQSPTVQFFLDACDEWFYGFEGWATADVVDNIETLVASLQAGPVVWQPNRTAQLDIKALIADAAASYPHEPDTDPDDDERHGWWLS